MNDFVNPIRGHSVKGRAAVVLGQSVSNRVERKTIQDAKWRKFLGRAWPFRFIPFIDFVLAAGSLVSGNINENSDFDVIVGVRQGRIFTARFFCFLTFNLFGWWARHPGKSRDRLCFNHFVTSGFYRLSPPRNEYWKYLYRNLIPVYGSSEAVRKFFAANADWVGFVKNYIPAPARVKGFCGQAVSIGAELLLNDRFGDWLEKILKDIQIGKIKKSLAKQSGYKPRIIYNDNELEFHPDTKRTEEFLAGE